MNVFFWILPRDRREAKQAATRTTSPPPVAVFADAMELDSRWDDLIGPECLICDSGCTITGGPLDCPPRGPDTAAGVGIADHQGGMGDVDGRAVRIDVPWWRVARVGRNDLSAFPVQFQLVQSSAFVEARRLIHHATAGMRAERDRPAKKKYCYKWYQSINRSIDQSINRPNKRAINQSINRNKCSKKKMLFSSPTHPPYGVMGKTWVVALWND